MVFVAPVFGAVLLAFIARLTVFQRTINLPKARGARAETLLSFATIRAVALVDEAVQDAERGQRGHLITGCEDYLRPYQEAARRIDQVMLDLQSDSATDPAQQRHWQQLQADIAVKMKEAGRADRLRCANMVSRRRRRSSTPMSARRAWRPSAPTSPRLARRRDRPAVHRCRDAGTGQRPPAR